MSMSTTGPEYGKVHFVFLLLGTLVAGFSLYAVTNSNLTDPIESVLGGISIFGVLATSAIFYLPIFIRRLRNVGGIYMNVTYSIIFGTTLLVLASLYVVRVNELEEHCDNDSIPDCQEFTMKVIARSIAFVNGILHVLFGTGLAYHTKCGTKKKPDDTVVIENNPWS